MMWCQLTIKTVHCSGSWGVPSKLHCGMIVCNDLDDKLRCISTRQLLPQLGRPLLAPVGPLLPIWARRGPISVPPHLQLGGTLVPRSTRHCLPPSPATHLLESFYLQSAYSLVLRALVMGCGPSGRLDFVLRTLPALRLCDPRNVQ